MYDLVALGAKIKSIRKKKKISQEKLAEMTSMNIKSIIRAENVSGIPSVETIIKIANALNIKIADLFESQEFKSRNEIINDIHSCINLMNDDELSTFYKSVYYYIH